MSKNKQIILIAFFLLPFSLCFGQGAIEKQTTINDKLFFGGGLGLQFGTYTGIEISPLVGYKPIDQLYLAIKGTYQYYKNNRTNYSSDLYGASILAMYSFQKRVVLHAEYEVLSIDKSFYYPFNEEGRLWIGSPMLGLGIMQTLGSRSAIMVSALWNLNENYYTPYSNPIIRLNFFF